MDTYNNQEILSLIHQYQNHITPMLDNYRSEIIYAKEVGLSMSIEQIANFKANASIFTYGYEIKFNQAVIKMLSYRKTRYENFLFSTNEIYNIFNSNYRDKLKSASSIDDTTILFESKIKSLQLLIIDLVEQINIQIEQLNEQIESYKIKKGANNEI